MSKTQYAYAVARIRALEVSLFSSSTIEQLIACKDEEAGIRFLQERAGAVRMCRTMRMPS